MTAPQERPDAAICREATYRWRTGRAVGRTIYAQVGAEPSDADVLIGVMDSPGLAAEAVRAHNARHAQERPEAGDGLGVQMQVRPVTDDDLLFWSRRGETPRKVAMRGDHIGATNIEVLRCDRGPGDFRFCWRVPYVVPGGDGTTYWFTMFCEGFPPVAAVRV